MLGPLFLFFFMFPTSVEGTSIYLYIWNMAFPGHITPFDVTSVRCAQETRARVQLNNEKAGCPPALGVHRCQINLH